jgi:hypothetical protein
MIDDPETTVRRGAGGGVEIEFRAAGGETVALRLNHEAAQRLRSLLPAASVGKREGETFTLALAPQRVAGFTAFQWGDTLAGLELRINDAEAMHVCFDAKAGNELLEAVKWFAAHMRDAPDSSRH